MSIKEQVYNKCMELVGQKIALAERAMKEAQESANAEEKSTAGDKHDTARAMSHIERDMYAKQLSEAVHLKKILSGIQISTPFRTVQSGSIVNTTNGKFFIAVALGKIDLDGEIFFVISPLSPLGQLLLDKKSGKKVSFNGKEISILEIL